MISGCSPDEGLNQEQSPSTGDEKTTILGDKLKNPYTVRNMKAAYKNLKTGQAGGRTSRVMEEEFSIRPTHYYVRFLPENWAAYDSLEKDTSLFLLDRPVDVKVVKEANYYHDPLVPKDKPTWQYTSVPLSYKVPFGNRMEIIDTLYLPDKAEKQNGTKGGRISVARQLAMDVLENEALLLTDNLTEDEKKLRERNTDAGARTQWLWPDWLPGGWTPAGFIKVWDERANRHIGVLGAKVRSWHWFSTGIGWVYSRDGRFVCDNLCRYGVSYEIIWEGAGYDIRDRWLQAYYNGPSGLIGDWNVDIDKGEKAFHYAHITRGMQCYNGNDAGLRKPYQYLSILGSLDDRLKISFINGHADDRITHGVNWGNWSFLNINPNIKIFRYANNREPDGDEVFSTTVHEVAHSMHWAACHGGPIGFAFTDSWTRESWATAVEWVLTQKEYGNAYALGIAGYGTETYDHQQDAIPQHFAYQLWRKDHSDPVYTPIFIDLIDNFNQRANRVNGVDGTNRPNDNVTGYTISQIESGFLRNVYGRHSLQEQLKRNKPNANVTDAQIDDLINSY